MSKRQRNLVVALVASAAVAAAVLIRLPVKSYLAQFAQGVQEAGPWGSVLLGALYVVATVLFVPGGLMTLLAGFLFGVVEGTITVSLASVLGASAAFWIGRTVAHDWVQRRFAQSLRFQAINAAVNRRSFKIVLLVRLSPVFPFVVTNYAFSLTKIRFRDFLLASWLGMLPATVFYVYLGSLAQNVAEIASGRLGGDGSRTILLVVGALATAAVVIVTARAARSALRDTLGDKPGMDDEAPKSPTGWSRR
jgi:uncharacterized membrane protein YdjX (TVP38/TMEM64 family)